MLDVIHIEPTNKCQLSCRCCGDKKTRPVGFMEVDHFREIVRQVVEINPNAGVRLFVSGDPLLHPHIEMFCRMALSQGLTDLVIHTNGYGLDEMLAKRLIVAGLPKISFSLDYYHKKIGDKGELVGWEAMRRVKHFVRMNDCQGHTEVTVQALAVSKEIANSYRRLFTENFGSSAAQVIKRPHSWDVAGSVFGSSRSNSGPCKFLKDRAAIYWDGRAALCCADLNGKLILGNVLQKPFSVRAAVDTVNLIGGKLQRKEKIAYPLPCKTCERYPE